MNSIDKCNQLVRDLISSDPKISRFLLNDRGKSFSISCINCDSKGIEGLARGYLLDGEPLEIALCANRLRDKAEIRETLIHVHAYDYSNKKCDFSSCNGLAYSEIRAAREAECEYYRSFPSFIRDYCVKRHASVSTASLYPIDKATKCVNKMYDSAMSDNTPS